MQEGQEGHEHEGHEHEGHDHEGHEHKHDDATAVAESGEGQKEKLQQTVDIADVGPCKKRIKITIDRSSIDKHLDVKYKELMGESFVPGFRPGKAPRQIVVRRYRKEVYDQIKSQLLLESLEQLADSHDVAPLNPPNLNPSALQIPEQGPFIYEFEVEVRPEFDLPNYKGMRLKRPVRSFTDEDVREHERRLLTRQGQLIPKDGPAEKGDYLVADTTTRHGDKVLGESKELSLRIDDTVTFKDAVASRFAEQTVGAKAGDRRTVDLTMTDAVADPSLRGQSAEMTLEVKDVKQVRLPEINEEFLEQYGVKNEEQFLEQIRVVLERQLEYEQRQSAREQILQQITAASQWQLPQDLLLRQSRKALARRVMEMREAGISEDEITSRERMLQRDVIENTAKSLKEHFVLQKIAEVEKIQIDEDDINLEIERIADQYGETPRRIRAQMEKEDLMETLAAQLIERKALDLILESAEYEDVTIGAEPTMSAADAQTVHGEMRDPTAAPPEEKKEEAKTEG